MSPKSDNDFVIEKSIAFSDMLTQSLGDISIRSKVESNLFIDSTTTLNPRKYENSLNFVKEIPSGCPLKDAGDVRSVTKGV